MKPLPLYPLKEGSRTLSYQLFADTMHTHMQMAGWEWGPQGRHIITKTELQLQDLRHVFEEEQHMLTKTQTTPKVTSCSDWM